MTLRKGEEPYKTRKFHAGTSTHTMLPIFHYEIAHYYTGSLGKVSNPHAEAIQNPELCCLFLAFLNSNEFPNTNEYPIV
jgi:hypothetical protein